MGKKMNLALSRPMESKIKSGKQNVEYAKTHVRIFGEKPLNNSEEANKKKRNKVQ
jgi:hypothetical protein